MEKGKEEMKILVESKESLKACFYKVCMNYQRLIVQLQRNYSVLFSAYYNFCKNFELSSNISKNTNNDANNVANDIRWKESSSEGENKKAEKTDSTVYMNYEDLESDLNYIYNIKGSDRNPCCFYQPFLQKDFKKNQLDMENYMDMYLKVKTMIMSVHKNHILKELNKYYTSELNQLETVILACEIRLNQLRWIGRTKPNTRFVQPRREEETYQEETKEELQTVNLTTNENFELTNMIQCCQKIQFEVRERLMPFFASFTIFDLNLSRYAQFRFKPLEEFMETQCFMNSVGLL